MEEHETEPSVEKAKPVSYAEAATKIHLPRFKKLQPFARKLFEICPMLSPLLDQFDVLWGEFSMYRRKISTFGTILLNHDCTSVILCQDYNGKSWTFPAGKVNQNENGIEAGARETYEETGFDPNCNLGQTKMMKEVNPDLPWDELREEGALRYTEGDGSGKLRTCYICHGVPEDFPFAPVARKEVCAVEWWDIHDLPKKSFAVIPFIKGLKNWIRKNGKKPQRSKTPGKNDSRSSSRANKRTPSSSKNRAGSKGKERSNKSTISDTDDDLIQSGLGEVGEGNRWSEDDMFRVNEKLIGRKIDYDGNSQVFATKGFDGVDPHAFRVVGGSFMNSGASTIAAAPDQDKLQPLYRIQDDSADNDDLKPFFSDGGEWSWGDAMTEALVQDNLDEQSGKKGAGKKSKKRSKYPNSPASSREEPLSESSQPSGSITNASGLAILSMLRGGTPIEEQAPRMIPAVEDDGTNDLDVFLTDREITSRSQQEKISSTKDEEKVSDDRNDTIQEETVKKESEHLIHLRSWIKSLPETKPTKHFGDFRFDVDAIMFAMEKK